MDIAGYRVLLKVKAKHLLAVSTLSVLAIICAAFTLAESDSFDNARQQVLLRNIGHQILLHSGDSTSKVLPVEKISLNQYRIRFENQFTFQPDSLVKIVSRSLAEDKLASNYVVNVLDCSAKKIVFAYAIAKNANDNITPCSGRRQTKNCYVVDITFQEQGIGAVPKRYLISGVPILAFIGLALSGSIKKKKDDQEDAENDEIKIGKTIFSPEKRQLTIAGNTTELTAKESKLLLIFAKNPNTIIQRSRLQKEIWEDEGVIVGRSLDMFISKLRKKLEHDTSLQLVNIHGKGYKLQITG